MADISKVFDTESGVWRNIADTQARQNILYFTSMSVSTANNAQICRIPASGTNSLITTNTVVLSLTFANPTNVSSNVTWTSYDGYIQFVGTCTAVTTADIILGQKGN